MKINVDEVWLVSLLCTRCSRERWIGLSKWMGCVMVRREKTGARQHDENAEVSNVMMKKSQGGLEGRPIYIL